MAAVHTGSWGLPDFGITEAVGKLLGSPTTSQGGSNIIGGQKVQTPPPKTPPQTKTTTTAPKGGSTGGTQPTGAPNNSQNSFNIDTEAANREAAARAQEEQRINQIRSNISGAYDPVFGELDRQLGHVPGQQDALSTSVNTLSDQQTGYVNTEEQNNTAKLEGSKANEQANAKSAFTDLSDNIRNLLQGAQFYLGSRGASDSSAAGAASEAIIQSADKTRGKILQTRNQALSAIDGKINDVQQLASTQRTKINDYKTNKLQEIVQWGVDRVNELNTQKAGAEGQKASAIANLIENTQQEFMARLQKLDDDVFNYKQSVDTWEKQRAADLEDFKTKYDIAAQYQSNTPGTLQNIFSQIDKTFTPITSGGAPTPTDEQAMLPGVG